MMLPVCTRSNYKISPSLIQISRMTMNEIEKIENFSIENQFGKIMWPGKTNLIGMNLDLIVNISENSAEVYPDDLYPNENKKPLKGSDLNKKARITLFNIENGQSRENFDEYLINMAKEQNCKHIEYDPKMKEWTFEVEHFSIYRFQEKKCLKCNR